MTTPASSPAKKPAAADSDTPSKSDYADSASKLGGVDPDKPKVDLTDLPASAKVTPLEQQLGQPMPPVDPVSTGVTKQNPAEAKALAAKDRIEAELADENPDDKFA